MVVVTVLEHIFMFGAWILVKFVEELVGFKVGTSDNTFYLILMVSNKHSKNYIRYKINLILEMVVKWQIILIPLI